MTTSASLIAPHGGQLITCIASSQHQTTLNPTLGALPQVRLSPRLLGDCEMLAIGAYSPLNGFMGKADAQSVIETLHLQNGLVWSIPIVLPVPESTYKQVEVGQDVALCSPDGATVAVLTITERFTLDLAPYCQSVYKTQDTSHPGVAAVQQQGNLFLGGPVQVLKRQQIKGLEAYHRYFMNPTETRQAIAQKGWRHTVAFQTRNPIHRAHEYLIKCALESVDGALVHPLVGDTKSDDIPADVRMQCYEVLLSNYFNPNNIMLGALPAPMHYAGPREAIHHMLIRKNYGCTHMIIGRDHAGVGNYYGTYEAQELVAQYVDGLGIIPLMFEHSFYSKHCQSMVTSKTAPPLENDALILSGTKVREMLNAGERPPVEFTRPEIADILITWAQQKVPVTAP